MQAIQVYRNAVTSERFHQDAAWGKLKMEQGRQYRPDIDGLRAVAVLSVILFHYQISGVSNGYLGVDIFFVISGYLITRQLQTIVSEPCFRTFLFSFFARRLRRILPALLAVLGVTLAVGFFILPPEDFKELGSSSFLSVFGLANLYFFNNTGYFDRAAEFQPLLHMWSLGVEEQFYLVWPGLFFLLFGRGMNRRTGIGVLVVGLIVGLAYAEWTEARDAKAAFYLPVPRAWELLVGALVAFVPRIESRALSELLGWCGCALLAWSLFFTDASEGTLGLEMVPTILGAALVVSDRCPSRVAMLLSIVPLRWIGQLSFSLYLWHWPVLVFFRLVNLEALPKGDEALVLMAVTTILSVASFFLIERPVRRLPLSLAMKVIAPALIMVPVACAGVVFFDGLEWRLSPVARSLAESAQDFSQRRPDCHRTDDMNLPLEESCRYGDQASLPSVVVWSDSHGVELAHALGERLGGDGQSVLGATYSSCPPAQGFASQYQEGCTQFNEDMLEFLLSRREIETVVLAAYYELYDRDGLWPQLVTGLDKTVAELTEGGKSVVLVLSSPEIGYSVPQAGVRLAMVTDEPRIDLARSAHDLFAEKATEMLNDLASRYPNTAIFDVAGTLCNLSVCPLIVEDRAMLFDADHLTMTAARRVVPELHDLLRDRAAR